MSASAQKKPRKKKNQDEALREVLDREAAEATRRAEGSDEAGRRQRVKKCLADWTRIHALLEPESSELETDECDAASRIEEGDSLVVALEREIRRSLSEAEAERAILSPRSIALRLAGAYDEEYAYVVERLPSHAVAAERVYAHLVSFEAVDRGIASPAIRSIARRATVLLLNRHYLAPHARSAAPDPIPEVTLLGSPGLTSEPELCIECGRDLASSDPGCEACEKTVS